MASWNEGATFYEVADEAALCKLHEIFYGSANEYDEKGSFMGTYKKPYPFYADASTERETRCETVPITITQPNQYDKTQYKRGSILLDREAPFKSPAIGYTNFRLVLPESMTAEHIFDSVELEIGGMRWETLWAEATGICEPDGTLKLWQTKQGRALPRIEYHDIRIKFHFLENVTLDTTVQLLYDIVPLGVDMDVGQAFPAVQNQYMGPEEGITLKDGLYSLRCNFNHPLLNLQLRTERPIKAARLVLNRGWELPFVEVKGGQWEIVFCPFGGKNGEVIGDLGLALNASRVDHMQIQIKTDDPAGPGKVVHWAQNYQLARIMGGMAGLAWSK
jgi:hypothetical protein